MGYSVSRFLNLRSRLCSYNILYFPFLINLSVLLQWILWVITVNSWILWVFNVITVIFRKKRLQLASTLCIDMNSDQNKYDLNDLVTSRNDLTSENTWVINSDDLFKISLPSFLLKACTLLLVWITLIYVVFYFMFK